MKKRKSPQLLLKSLTITRDNHSKSWASPVVKLQMKLFLGKEPKILEVQIDEEKSKRTKLPFNMSAISNFSAKLSNNKDPEIDLSFLVSALNSVIQTGAVHKSEDSKVPSQITYEELSIGTLLDDEGHSSQGQLSVLVKVAGGGDKMAMIEKKFLYYLNPATAPPAAAEPTTEPKGSNPTAQVPVQCNTEGPKAAVLQKKRKRKEKEETPMPTTREKAETRKKKKKKASS